MKAGYDAWSFCGETIKVRLEGFNLDRLLAQAVEDGIIFRDLRVKSDTEAEAWLSASHNRRLRRFLRSKYKLTVLEERGPRRMFKQLARRYLLVLGVIIVVGGVVWQSLLVNRIEIDGYKAIPEAQLRRCLEENGIKEGAYIPKIKWTQAKQSIYYTFPQITWIQLVYDGRRVVLNLSESTHQSLEEAQEEREARKNIGCSNIVASHSGVIRRVDAMWGETRVALGERVEAGQVLIGGCIPLVDTTHKPDAPTEYHVRAQGQVWADVEYHLNFKQERFLKSQQAEEGCEESESSEGSEKGEGSGGDAAKGESIAIVSDKTERTETQAQMKANQQLRTWAKNNLPKNSKIVNKGLKFLRKENIIEVDVTLVVRQEIGTEQEIAFGDTEGNGNPRR